MTAVKRYLWQKEVIKLLGLPGDASKKVFENLSEIIGIIEREDPKYRIQPCLVRYMGLPAYVDITHPTKNEEEIHKDFEKYCDRKLIIFKSED